MSHLLRSRKGQSTAILAVVLTGLMGAMTVSIDAGRVFVAKEQLQSAADAGALAGAAYLPQSPNEALAAATSTAEANGLASGQVSAAIVGALRNEIQVTVTTTEPLIFGPVIGLPSASVKAGAVAASGMPRQMQGLIPIGVYQGTYIPGQTYTLKQNTGSGGNFGALWYGDGDPGANTYRSDLENGSPAVVTLGSTIETKPGEMDGPTEQGLEDRMSAPASPVGDPTSPRFVYVPIVTTPCAGRSTVTVVGFAAFWIESVSDGEVTGEFLQHVVSSEIIQTDVSTTGLTGVTLIR